MTVAIIAAAYLINSIILGIVVGRHLRYRREYGYNDAQEQVLVYVIE